MRKRIFLSAGEHSGDQLSAELFQKLKQENPNIEGVGIGGKKMKAAGIHLLCDITPYSSIGLIESLSKLPFLLFQLKKVKKWLKKNKIDLFIAIDCRVLNDPFLRLCQEKNIPLSYYVTPTKWWLYKQYQPLNKNIHVYPAFQIEADFYQKKQHPYHYFGHPLLDILNKESPQKTSSLPTTSKKVIALFPGSRQQEVKKIYPILCQCAQKLEKTHPNLYFISSISAPHFDKTIKKISQKYPLKNHAFYTESAKNLIQRAHFSMACSGSISIEHILLETPCIITYKAHPISFALVKKRYQIQKFISWPNILSQEIIFPECVQDKATPQSLYKEALNLLDNPTKYNTCKNKLKKLKVHFGKPGATQKVAKHINKHSLC
ncbi:MAG: lipid-A-disaccharide synthase [bacterium]